MLRLYLFCALALLAYPATAQERTNVVRAALEKIILERTPDSSVGSTFVVDTLLRCFDQRCNPTIPASITAFLKDTLRVQLGAADSVVRCDLATYPRKCAMHGGTAVLKLDDPALMADTAWVGFSWTELFNGKYWGHGGVYRFVRKSGRWVFDTTTEGWST